jgi:hypothetical protein
MEVKEEEEALENYEMNHTESSYPSLSSSQQPDSDNPSRYHFVP